MLTHKSAIDIALAEADIMVKPPAALVVVPANGGTTVRLRLVCGSDERSRSVTLDCPPRRFETLCRVAIADMKQDLRDEIGRARWSGTTTPTS